ncbi:MAG: hypothetical protein RL007_2854 [Bacteroidota bacterium]
MRSLVLTFGTHASKRRSESYSRLDVLRLGEFSLSACNIIGNISDYVRENNQHQRCGERANGL